jgi:hypothetical protein
MAADLLVTRPLRLILFISISLSIHLFVPKRRFFLGPLIALAQRQRLSARDIVVVDRPLR